MLGWRDLGLSCGCALIGRTLSLNDSMTATRDPNQCSMVLSSMLVTDAKNSKEKRSAL
jgi:hypothetical protein